MKMPRMLVYTVLSTCACIALLAIVAGTAFAAPAHAKVLSATPSIGATITQAPTTVTVVCAENINPNPKLSNLYVYAPSGDLISQGDAKVSLNNPLQMAITIKPSGDGVYVVQWKTVSAADGDPDAGAFVFTVKANAAVAAATPTVKQTPVASNGGTSNSSSFPALPVVIVGLVALIVGLSGGLGVGRSMALSAARKGTSAAPSVQTQEEEPAQRQP